MDGLMAQHKRPAQQFAMPPVNVRVLHRDGTYTPVECIYTGTRNGINHWNTVHEIALVDGDRKVADEMPPNTEVHLYVRGS